MRRNDIDKNESDYRSPISITNRDTEKQAFHVASGRRTRCPGHTKEEILTSWKVWNFLSTMQLLTIALVMCFSPVSAQHVNVMIGDYFSERNYYPNEPSIAVNPKNTNQMIVTTNGPVENYYYSNDAGITWNRGGEYSFDVGLWGDPCVVADTSGNFYFFHLERLYVSGQLQMPDRIFCRRMTCDQMGSGWSGVSYTGLNPPKMQDKEWAAYDPVSKNLYVVWSEFDVYGSVDPDHFSNILFSRSADGGVTWSDPKRINEVSGDCLDGSNSVMGAMPAVGPNGEIYVTWPGPEGIILDKSTDQGESWYAQDILVADNPAGDHYSIPGISRGGSCPAIACDLSYGPNRGTVYINWSDQINGPDDTDIWLSKSTDGGQTWSLPKRVNDDPAGKHQMFHWITVDQTNGFLYVVFYDRRHYDDNRTDVYLAVSRDGGETFSNYKISQSSFTPDGWVFMGDYSNVVAMGEIIRPVWARMDTGHVSVWTAIIDPEIITDVPEVNAGRVPDEFEIRSVYPNPFNVSTKIYYRIPKNGHVLLKAYNILGKEVEMLFHGHQRGGEHRFVWNAKKHPSGIYFICLNFETMVTSTKAALIK